MTLPDKDSAAAWGVPFSDYAPVTDPTTDLSASAFNEIAADVAAMTRTAPRAIVSWAGTTFSAPNSVAPLAHDSVWGTSVAPTILNSSDGFWEIQWPTTVTDELGNSHAISMRWPGVPRVIGKEGVYAYIYAYTSNSVHVGVNTFAGVPDNCSGITLVMDWY